jgi:exopolyphosphatase/guanosine-5'-triphosphate,3'-diphosphate pyrophosphatase
MYKAVLDLGTNTFHLLIAKLVNEKLEVLIDRKDAVKIGEKGLIKGEITTTALERAIATLKLYKSIIDAEKNIESVEVIATSAFRDAKNATAVCNQIKNETGFEINIISGDEEAQLIYQGVKLSGALQNNTAMIVDIGGGSVEFIICTNNHIEWKQSFDIGGIRLLELFHKNDPIDIDEIASIEAYLNENLFDLHNAVNNFKPTILIGASGAFDTFVDIINATKENETSSKNTFQLELKSFNEIHQQLIKSTKLQRAAIPGMITLRVEMIVVASCLIKYLLEKYQLKQILTSKYSLKEGVFINP